MISDSLFDLTGEVALVTGASSGLGERISLVLASRGAKVALAARRIERLEEISTRVTDMGGNSIALRLDVTDLDSYEGILDEIESRFGPVSVLVNNAGIAKGSHTLEATVEDWEMVMRTNLDPVLFLSKAVAKRMVRHGIRGRIINMSSMLAYRTPRYATAYAASKVGVAHLTKTMAVDLAEHGIRVNGIAPGYIETDLNRKYLAGDNGKRTIANIPIKRVGEPSDLDGPILLLASEKASSFMTGTIISVDGGHSCHFV